MKKKKISVLTISFIIIIIFIILFLQTGILQDSKINNRDLDSWQFDENGVILGAEEFTLEGSKEVCWFLIHGYSSTPDEMREIAQEINFKFNETIFVTRLKGHGELPSRILNLTLIDWYKQVSEEYDVLNESCQKINVIGFSFGGALATRLAEKKEINNLYLLSPYLFANYKWYYLFRPEKYLALFSNILVYSKKNKIAQINSKEGLEKHIAYWNMPFLPVKRSKIFFSELKYDLDKIEVPILLQQSKNDKTSNIKSSEYIYENIKSPNKKLIVFEKSNHVILEDYDKNEAIKNIIDFELDTRS
jgi:carboxylesterase